MLTVTKFESEDQNNFDQHKLSRKPSNTIKSTKQTKKKSLNIKRKSPNLNQEKAIYSFESFDTFCNFCTFIHNSPYANSLSNIVKSSDLYEYNNCYYLIFTGINLETRASAFLCSAITEFAHYIDHSELFERKITEYGKAVIKEKAIETALEYFA